MEDSIQKDYELLKSIATGFDKEALYYMLLSQINNKKRLETILCDILNIKNAVTIIDEFRKSNAGKAKEKDKTLDYFHRIQEMFPDVDAVFLLDECTTMQSEEECTRFINNVMLKGLYYKTDPKRSDSLKYLWEKVQEEARSARNPFEIAAVGKNVENQRKQTAAKAATPTAPRNDNQNLKINDWVAEKTAELERLFPRTDPTYLKFKCRSFNGSVEEMQKFVSWKLDRNDMPSREEYEKRATMKELVDRYTKNFSVEDFLKEFPNPWEHFERGKRNRASYSAQSLQYLTSNFAYLYSTTVKSIFEKNKMNLYVTYKDLKKSTAGTRRRPQSDVGVYKRPVNPSVAFLQEVAFIENEQKIQEYLNAQTALKKNKLQEAKRTGSLLECQCCYDPEVLVEDAVYCPKDHSFCKSCLIKLFEVEMGRAKYEFFCLAGCGQKYSLKVLEHSLEPEMYMKLIKAIQLEEVKAAGIDDLVNCPFCNYVTVLPPESKVLSCMNPQCRKESCRLCKSISHIPLKCEEVEKSEEAKMRIYIEDKMTEALIRRCYKCKKAFVKEEGCNKMKCVCGAMMCYICRKPVTDYSHFNGQGGTNFKKCPLYSTNDELNVEVVERVAEKAKEEVLKANPGKTLKHDPTVILPERSYDKPKPGMRPGGAVERCVLLVQPPADV